MPSESMQLVPCKRRVVTVHVSVVPRGTIASFKSGFLRENLGSQRHQPRRDTTSSKTWIFWASALHSLSHSRPTWDSSSPSTKGLDDSSHTAKLLTSLSFELDWRRKRKSIVKTPWPKHTHFRSRCRVTKPLMQSLLIKLLRRTTPNQLCAATGVYTDLET